MPACAGLRALYAQSAVLVRIFHVLGIFWQRCVFFLGSTTSIDRCESRETRAGREASDSQGRSSPLGVGRRGDNMKS